VVATHLWVFLVGDCSRSVEIFIRALTQLADCIVPCFCFFWGVIQYTHTDHSLWAPFMFALKWYLHGLQPDAARLGGVGSILNSHSEPSVG